MNKSNHSLFYLLLVSVPAVFFTDGAHVIFFIVVLCFTLFLIYFISSLRESVRLPVAPGLTPALLFCCLALFQLIPLPPAMIEYLSQTTSEYYRETIWIVSPGAWMPLTLAPEETIQFLVCLFAITVIYNVLVHLFLEYKTSKKAAYVLSIQLTAVAVASLLIAMIVQQRDGAIVTYSPGVSAWHDTLNAKLNPLTGVIIILMPMAWAAYLITWSRIKMILSDKDMRAFLPWRIKLRHLFAGGTIILSLAAVVVSGSLATLLITIYLFVTFFFLVFIQGLQKGRWLSIYLLLVVSIVVGCLVAFPGLGRYSIMSDVHVAAVSSQRAQETLEAFSDFQVFGAGLQAYPKVMAYRSLPLSIDGSTGEGGTPHLLQLLAETGVAGLMIALWFVIRAVNMAVPARRQKHHGSTMRYLYAGSVTSALALVMTGLAGPGIGVVPCLVILAILTAAAVAFASLKFTGRRYEHEVDHIETAAVRAFGAPVILVFILSVLISGGAVIAKWKYSRDLDVNLSQLEDVEKERLIQNAKIAATLAPANTLIRIGLADNLAKLGRNEEALRQYVTALRLSPLSGLNLSRVGLMYSLTNDPEKTMALMRAASKASFRVDDFYRKHISLLLSLGLNDVGLQQVKSAISQNPADTGEYLALLDIHAIDVQKPQEVLPDMWLPHLIFGQKMLKKGERQAAERSLQDAVRFSMQNAQPDINPFLELTDFYLKEDKSEDALEIALTGIRLFPDNSEIRYLAARAYENLGIIYRAEEEYRKTLILNPLHQLAADNLRRLTPDR